MNRNNLRPYTAPFYRNNRLPFCLAVLATLANTLLGFAITWILQEMLDAAVGIPGSMSVRELFRGAMGVIAALIALKVLLCFSKPRYLKTAMMQFKNHIFRNLLQKNILTFQRESTAGYLSAFSNDLASIETNYLEAEFLLVRNSIEMSGALLMMLWYNPVMTAIAIGFLLLPTAAAAFQGSRMEEAEQTVSEENARAVSMLRECLSGFSVIKSFAAERQMSGLMEDRIRGAETAKCRKRQITTALDSIGSLAALTAQLGTFLAGTVLILSGHAMTPGILVAFMDLTSTFIDPVSELPALIGNRRAAKALIGSLAQRLETNIREAPSAAPQTLRTGITVSGLNYSYEPGKPILQDLSVRFEAGKSYAVVGASGSGKSTLLNLLLGADDYEGSIRYDDAELREISSGSLYSLVSTVAQNVFIFNATIRENITLFSDFPEDGIRVAMERSGLSSLAAEKGDRFLCGENGCNLSGGEKQRISIARSLLRRNQVLLADEVTSALDQETAYQVTDAILSLGGLTKIVVTHALEPSLLRRYDRILTMKSGKIIESGSFNDLFAQKGYFYSLFTVSQ